MFTPIESSLGALLIQAATSSYMHLEGKAVGFSSILYNFIFKPTVHSVSIVVGLFLSSTFIKNVLPVFAPTVVPIMESSFKTFYQSPLSYLTAGLIVGFGSSAGCGCTSGHMLIGMSRLRWRSFVATCTFFLTAVVTTMVSGNYNKIGSSDGVPNYHYDTNFTTFKENMVPLLATVLIGQLWSYVILPKLGLYLKKNAEASGEKDKNDNIVRAITGVSAGFLFGCGLFISGMTDTTKIIGFLSFLKPENFDPSLAMIPLFAIIPNIILWKKWLPQNKSEAVAVVNRDQDPNVVVPPVKKPEFEPEYDLNFSNKTETRFLLGNVLFGLGWGVAGICPGPGVLTLFTEMNALAAGRGVLYMAGFLCGSYAEKHVR